MLYSGASLTRAAGLQAERLEKLKASDSVKSVSPTRESGNSLDENAQGALLRFARFVTKESKNKKAAAKPLKRTLKGIPVAYAVQLQIAEEGRGAMLDIYI